MRQVDSLPNFIGIGAPKAGTTWLAKCLAEHPEVFMAGVKEVEFWKLPDAEQRLDDYRAVFRGSGGRKAVGEYSVRYLTLPGVPERIGKVLPRVKLVVSLRNPIDQVASHFWHLRRQNFKFVRSGAAPASLEEALLADPEALLQPARYAGHLARFSAVFPPGQIHVLLYEDIVSRPEQVLRELFAFLEVDPDFRPPSIHERGSAVRQGTSPRNATMDQIHHRLYDVLVRYAYNPLKRTVGSRRAALLKERLRARLVMEKAFMRQGYPPLTEQTRALLRGVFASDLTELSRLTGRDFSHWQ